MLRGHSVAFAQAGFVREKLAARIKVGVLSPAFSIFYSASRRFYASRAINSARSFPA